MKKYIVTGYAKVIVEVTVEAENEEEAIKKAYDNIGIDNYCGNGGTDKLVGVCDTDEVKASIYPDSDIEYTEVEEAVQRRSNKHVSARIINCDWNFQLMEMRRGKDGKVKFDDDCEFQRPILEAIKQEREARQ